MNNETIGISAEIAIANSFQIAVNPEYATRADECIVGILESGICDIFKQENIPSPATHVAERQNPIDFILSNQSTLSVKTNQKSLGKVAPQIIGQPTSTTYFEYFDDFLEFDLPQTYAERIALFKTISINEIETVIQHYWDNLFECDHLLYFYDFLDKQGRIKNSYNYIYLKKLDDCPNWDKKNFEFSKTLDNWVESCTVRYVTDEGKKYSIGEFQAHRKRDCLKFRFNIKNLLDLINDL